MKIGYCLESLQSISLYSCGALNVINTDTTGRAAEDVRHVEGVAKGLKPHGGMTPNAQTAKKTTPLSQDLVTYIKKKKKKKKRKYLK